MCTHRDILHTCGCDTRLSRACPAAAANRASSSSAAASEPCPQMRVTRLTFSDSECAVCQELDMVDDAPLVDITTSEFSNIEEGREEGGEREDGGEVDHLDQGWLYVL
ncbi:hypothetical protein NpNSSI1_00007919 [Neofusicoccum parvum]|nr:hypothetical protein NpNSSI1_00007919 [Neofusicoccum parvum]